MTANGPQNDLHAYNTAGQEPASGKHYWSQLTPSGEQPWHLAFHTSVNTPQGILIFGGVGGSHEGGKDSNNLYNYNVKGNSWSKLSPSGKLPAPRSRHSACSGWGGDYLKMYVFGGRTQHKFHGWVDQSDLWAYDVKTNHWTAVAASNPPGSRHGHSMVDTRLGLVVLGGNVHNPKDKNGPADLWRYRDGSWTELSLSPRVGGAAQGPSWTEGHSTILDGSGTGLLAFGGVQNQTYSNSMFYFYGSRTINSPAQWMPDRLYVDKAILHWSDLPVKGPKLIVMLSGAVLFLVLAVARAWVCIRAKRFPWDDDEMLTESGLEVSD